MTRTIVEFKNVEKKFTIKGKNSFKDFLTFSNKIKTSYWKLENINFTISESSCVAILGDNGAGKSTLMSMINDIIKPDKGKVILNERPSGFLELGSGFNPELSGYENIFLYGSLLGMSRKEIKLKLNDILNFSELKEKVYFPLKIFSQGMIARLAFSILIHNNTKLILLDEILAVGDFSFQAKCFNFFKEFRRKGGTTVIIHHTPKILSEYCDMGIYLKNGKIAFVGDIKTALSKYAIDAGFSPSEVLNSKN